jgi:hypothetical protein
MENFNKKTIHLPSGFSITIREQHGGDEELLSTPSAVEDGSYIPNYLSAVIIGSSLESKSSFSPQEIMDWKVNDKYYALLEARIFNLGDNLRFKYTFQKSQPKIPLPFVQDLREYTWDLSKPETLPQPGEIDEAEPWKSYNPKRIKMYLLGNADGRALKLNSGKEVRYRFLNTHGEQLMAKKNRESINSNDIFRVRFLEWKNPHAGNEWFPIENFNVLSSRDLQEIRKDILLTDEGFDLIVDVIHPETGESDEAPIIYIPDFFRPTEI